MPKEIVADVGKELIKVGVVEDGELVELYIEKRLNESIVGNIYKGRVANVLKGMQAAFINIGLDKNAFLYVGDIKRDMVDDGEIFEKFDAFSINEMLRPGQDVVVQVIKDPIGTKGARVTTNITLAGRFLVLMPLVDNVGISRRIEDERERERLKTIINDIKVPPYGVIVRTAAEACTKEELEEDLKYLIRLWKDIKKSAKNLKSPALIYKDMDFLLRIARDIFTNEVAKFHVNEKGAYEKIIDYCNNIAPEFKEKVVFYENRLDLFKYFNIEKEIEKALSKKVWLKSGGYIVIDKTEALTVIDVNTGKYIGSVDLEDTVLTTNLEAAKEIAKQVRLRDIGGIILIDFIDMASEEHKRKVLEYLDAQFKKDRTKTQILDITALGLVEVTRKKIRQSIYEILGKVCPYCEGSGKIISYSNQNCPPCI